MLVSKDISLDLGAFILSTLYGNCLGKTIRRD